jgi:hypothetical protein
MCHCLEGQRRTGSTFGVQAWFTGEQVRRVAQSSARGEEAGACDRICPRSSKRVQHYRELIKLTRATLAYVDQAATQVWQAPSAAACRGASP